jgi:hypothetical protein
MLFDTMGTDSGKDHLMALYLMPAAPGRLLVQPMVVLQALQVVYASAFAAAEMWMGLLNGVISLHRKGHPHNDSFL